MTLRFFRLARLAVLAVLLLAGGAAAARAEISVGPQSLKPHQAWSKVERNESILIDVRTPAEWRQTGVPREARRITLSDPRGASGFVAAVMKAVRGDVRTPVTVICRTGNRSAKAAALLSKAGFKTVYDVAEGVVGNGKGTGWAARGLPMVSCGACAAEN